MKQKHKRVVSAVLSLVMILAIASNSMIVFAEGEIVDEFDKLREKAKYLATGGDHDPMDPNMQVLLKEINNLAQDLLDRINPNPTPDWGANDYLWQEYMLGNRGSAYSDSNNTQFTIRGLKFMALAFQTKGCELYQNEKLKNEILRGLDYIYENHFKKGVETNSYGNWFTWEIGGPIYLCETVLLMCDYLTAEQVQAYVSTALQGASKTGGSSYTYVGANALWRDRVRMYAGILLKDSESLEYVQNDVPTYMGYVTSGDGYYEDGTFIQHSDVVYNGGYGKEAFSDISHFIYMLDNSPWEITGPERDNMSTIVEETYVPFMYKGVFMDMVRGREITRKDTTDAYAGITISLGVLLFSDTVPEDEGIRFKGMIKEWMNNENAIRTLNEGAGVAWYLYPVYNLSKTLEIIKDDSIKPVSNKGKSYTFGKGVRTVHATDKFTFGLSMYSKDIKSYEVGDSNTKGWYTGLGQTYVYTPDIGQYTYQKPTLDWYRLSGVTAVNGVSIGSHRNSNSFSGSTTLNGTYSTAGLEVSTDVSAKKSWFMFDDEVVALGTGITSAHNNNVETTVDNHYITGDNDLIINGEKQPDELGWNGKVDNAKWALIEGNVNGSNIGVYFPQETTIGAVRETRTGKWTDLGSYNVDENIQSANYITMWIDHGTKPENDSYAYVLLPGTTAAQVENYAISSDTEIIRQDNDVHAVYEKTLHVLGANIWEDGYHSIDAMGVNDYLSVDKASTIMINENDDVLNFALSDTTKKNSGTINVDINRAAVGVISKDSRIKVIQTSPSIRLEVDVTDSVGNPIEAKFSFRNLEVPGETSITNMLLDDDNLTIEFTDALWATSYKLFYGTESGNYSEMLVTSQTKAELKGLNANTTYYFAVKAFNDSGDGKLSREESYTIGNTRTLIEEFEDFSKTVSYSGGWATDSTNADTYYNGDDTRIKRDDSDKTNPRREEYITYYAPSPKDFELTTYDYGLSKPEDNTIVQFYGSTDNMNWVSIPATKNGTVEANKWSKVVYTNAEELDSSIKYIKIAVSNNTKVYAPQLSKLQINYAWTSERVVMDMMLDDSRAYEVNGDVVYTKGDGAKFGGDKDVLIKNGSDDATMLYSYTNIQSAELVAFITNTTGDAISFMSSKDGISFVPVDPRIDTDTGDYGGYNKVVYSIPELEDNTNYLLITISGEADSIAIAGLSLSYIHEITPIEKIQFNDKQLEAVMKYDLVPTIKLAPMNATGELYYTVSDKDIVTVNSATGVVQAEGLGTAILTAEVLGAAKDISANIIVRTSQNLALNASTSASSVEKVYHADKATDGDYLTRWESRVGNDQWLQIDLGFPKEFGAIELNWQQYATEYKVQGSMNGTDWEDFYTETNGMGGDVWIEFDEVQKYQYIRLIGTKATAAYSLYEFRILSFKVQSEQDGVIIQNLALGKTATTSGNDSSNSNPNAAIDGDTSTRWSSARTDNQWYTIDLGAPCNIYRINLLWEAAYGKEYDIQVYNDINNLNTVVSERNGSAGWKKYELDEPAQGRYVRMQGITRGTQYGYSLYEFEVYGSVQSTTVSAIEFTSDKLTVLRNHKKAAKIITDPPYVNEGSVTFVSMNPEIATVSNKGIVTGITTGSAIIMAFSTLSDDVYDSCDVTVTDYNGPPIPVSSLEVQGGVAIIEKGTSAQLDAIVDPDNASIKNIHWTSSDEQVLLVTNEGLIRAIGLGTAVVRGVSVANPDFVYEQEISVIDAEVETVKALINAIGVVTLESRGDIDAARDAYNNLTDDQKELVDNYEKLVTAEAQYEALVEAVERVNGVTLDKNAINLTVGKREQLTATIIPSDAINKKVIFTSNADSVASVIETVYNTDDGTTSAIIKANSMGTAVITATAEDGGHEAICIVTVKDSSHGNITVTGISLDTNTKELKTNQTSTIRATIIPSDATNKKVTFTSNADSIVSVINTVYNTGDGTTSAIIKTNRVGTAVITAITEDGGHKAICTVTVKGSSSGSTVPVNINVTVITVSGAGNENSITTRNGTLQMTATVTPANATNKSVVWSVKNDTGTATIDQNTGMLTAYSDGTVTVKATAKDGSNVAGSCVITISGQSDSNFDDENEETPLPLPEKKTFSDIGNYPWAKEAIEVLASKGIIKGTSETTFEPGKNITRADFICLLVRGLGLKADVDSNFADVNPNDYYYKELGIAKKLGIAAGVGGNRFNPRAEISRQDMMVLITRALKSLGMITEVGSASDMYSFADAAQVSDYAIEGVATLIKEGIIKGNNSMINPHETTIRAEVAVVIYNIITK